MYLMHQAGGQAYTVCIPVLNALIISVIPLYRYPQGQALRMRHRYASIDGRTGEPFSFGKKRNRRWTVSPRSIAPAI